MLIISTLPPAWHDVCCGICPGLSPDAPCSGMLSLTTCPETTAYRHYFSLLHDPIISTIILFVLLLISCVPVMCLLHFSSIKEDSSLSPDPCTRLSNYVVIHRLNHFTGDTVMFSSSVF